MPQKKAKKAKLEKPKKPVKAAPKGVVGTLLKKAAKVIGKKPAIAAVPASAKKKAEPAKKAAPPAPALKLVKKAGKLEKKPAPEAPAKKKLVAAPAPAPLKEKKVLRDAPDVKAKGKKIAEAPSVAPLAKQGKKKPEVVVEVPAPKGVAMLGREGKKKSRSSESAANNKKRCREPGCEHELLLSGYCRLHYIKNWRKVKRKEAILASGQLNNYVEELVSKYPDKYLDVIRQDLATEKDWVKVVVDLELESSDEEGSGDEDMEGVAEGVRREREFDDDSDSF